MMVVEFDELDEVWRFRREAGRADATITAVLHGIGWTVDLLDPASPLAVEVAHPPTEFARAATAILLGPAAAEVIGRPAPDPTEDELTPVVGEVELDDDGAGRRAAMGLLAVALTSPFDQPFRAIDLATFLRRAHLDGRPVVVPAGVEAARVPDLAAIADEAEEALDMLPSAVERALDGRPPAPIATAWAVAAGGVRDAADLVAAATIDARSDADVLQAFDEIALRWDAPDVVASTQALRRAPTFAGPEMGPGPVPVTALLADPRIRGVAGLNARHDRGQVEVDLVTRPGITFLGARVLDSSGQVLASGPLTGSGDDPRRLRATFELAENQIERVEVLRDLDDPLLSLELAQAAHRGATIGEVARVLRQLAGVVDQTSTDRSPRVGFQLAQIAEQLRTLGQELPPAVPLPESAVALPSDALATVLAESGGRLLGDLDTVDDPAIRAMRADEAAALLEGSVVPWVQELLGDVLMREARARAEAGSGDPAAIADRAADAYLASRLEEEAGAARAWADDHRGRRP